MESTGSLKVVVIGASAAGLRAACRARRLLGKAKITVIDQGSYISYGACGMPYFVSGDIENVDKLRSTPYGLVRDPDFFSAAKDLEVLTMTRVERINRKERKVLCKAVETQDETEIAYDKLVIAAGASPNVLPGVEKKSPRITTFKTLHDAISIKKALAKGEIRKVGIIGGGFIGCELAESFGSLWGAEVVMIEAAPQILPGIMDEETARGVEAYLKSEDVEIHTGCPVEEVTDTGDGVVIKTKDGSIEADHAVMALGVKPQNSLAVECGIDIGELGGIVVDKQMRTSDPDIYAAGDVIEVKHAISGKPALMPLGSLANRQGRVAGSNIGGKKDGFGPVVGSAALKVFDLNVACTGLTERAAAEAGFDASCAWGTFSDRPEYYPESENVLLKLVFEKGTQRLLGMQGYGTGEVVKRVDLLASLLKKEGRLDDLIDSEFAYAPPFAPAVDPLFSLGCAAQNAVREGVEGLSPGADCGGRTIIDVRTPEEMENDPIPLDGIINIPLEELRKRWEEVPKDKPVLLVCSKGLRSAESTRIMLENGIKDAVYLGGGILMKASWET